MVIAAILMQVISVVLAGLGTNAAPTARRPPARHALRLRNTDAYDRSG